MKQRYAAFCCYPFFRLPAFFPFRFGVCRSSDFYIQMQSFLQLHQRTHFAFSPGHYSPSNDRLSPYAECSAQKRYFVITATKGACFANMYSTAAPTCPGIPPDSLVQHRTRMRVRSIHASSGRAFATKAILLFNLFQTKIDRLLRQSMHFLNIPVSRFCFARCPYANPRRCSKGFFSSVALTLNASSASEVKSFEPQLVSRLVAHGASRLLRNSLGISPHFR